MGLAPDSAAPGPSYVESFARARGSGDLDGMAGAALALAALQRFGEPPGRTPALLHQAYLAARAVPATRTRLAAALARSWAYAGDAARGAPFAREAVSLAERLGERALLADALDARLATCWGPDDLAERVRVTARLDNVAAHVEDERARLDAHLWRLTTALESLDVVGVHRQLAALDVLAEESGSATVRFFAATRRAMHAVLVGDLDRAAALVETAQRYADEGGVADAYAVHHALSGELARHRGDLARLREEAALYEAHAVEHGMQSLLAEAAVLWLEVGDPDRAGRLAQAAAGSGLRSVPRDVDWLLTVTKVVDAAAGSGDADLAGEGLELLAPCAGRAVVNAGAVSCQGVVEDYLFRAARIVGDARADDWRARAAAAYRRLGAPWWLARLGSPREPGHAAGSAAPAASAIIHLRPLPGGAAWSVGPEAAPRLLPDLKGLHYLRALLMRPGADVQALELTAVVAGHATIVAEPGSDVRIDRQALAAYRGRLRDLDEELDEAQSWADPARVERLTAERDALLDEVRRATGLGGRLRTSGGSAERARVAVRKAIAAALARIDAEDPVTARLLRTSVRTGTVCRYDPDPGSPVTWSL